MVKDTSSLPNTITFSGGRGYFIEYKTIVLPGTDTSAILSTIDEPTKQIITSPLLVKRFDENRFDRVVKENGERMISDKVIEKSQSIVKYLSFYLPNASGHQVYFEEDDDNSILIFIEIHPHEILINVYEDRIEYSYSDVEIDQSLEVSRIPFREENIISAMNGLLEKGLERLPISAEYSLFQMGHTSTDTSERKILTRTPMAIKSNP